jgi:hypothetical protein
MIPKKFETKDINGNILGYQWKLSNGDLHREDGPAIEYANGDKAWYLNGKNHRENGPAVENAYGYKAWYIHGELHREDGPAVEYADGTKYWHLNGEKLSKEKWKEKVSLISKKNVSNKLEDILDSLKKKFEQNSIISNCICSELDEEKSVEVFEEIKEKLFIKS